MESLNLQCLRVNVDTQKAGPVLYIELHRPQAYNAISMELLQELHTVLDALQLSPAIFVGSNGKHSSPRVVVLHGAGQAFCGGVDVKAADRGLGGTVHWRRIAVLSVVCRVVVIGCCHACMQPVVFVVFVCLCVCIVLDHISPCM